MQAAPNAEIWLFKLPYDKNWTCQFKGKVNDLKVEIDNKGETPEEAIDATYKSFLQLGKGVEAITTPLLIQSPVRPSKPKFDDDDIPF